MSFIFIGLFSMNRTIPKKKEQSLWGPKLQKKNITFEFLQN